MSKKIKSVKLKKDYCNGFDVISSKGTPALINSSIINQPPTYTYISKISYMMNPCFTEKYIKDHPDFFEIEYEPEVKTKKILLKTEIKYSSLFFEQSDVTAGLIKCIRDYLKTNLIRLEVTELPNE